MTNAKGNSGLVRWLPQTVFCFSMQANSLPLRLWFLFVTPTERQLCPLKRPLLCFRYGVRSWCIGQVKVLFLTLLVIEMFFWNLVWICKKCLITKRPSSQTSRVGHWAWVAPSFGYSSESNQPSHVRLNYTRDLRFNVLKTRKHAPDLLHLIL